MEENIRIGVFKTLRKLGFDKNEIDVDAPIKHYFFFDKQEWNCFLFLLESRFNVFITLNEEKQMYTLGDVIQSINNQYLKLSRNLQY